MHTAQVPREKETNGKRTYSTYGVCMMKNACQDDRGGRALQGGTMQQPQMCTSLVVEVVMVEMGRFNHGKQQTRSHFQGQDTFQFQRIPKILRGHCAQKMGRWWV